MLNNSMGNDLENELNNQLSYEINTQLTSERWLGFWFKPYLYLHSSWMQDVDQRLLTENSSSLAWHVAYPYVCNVYGIATHYRDMADGVINNVMFDMLHDSRHPQDMASFMISGISKSINFSQAEKRVLLQRSRALSLRKRFYESTENIAESDGGLLLIYLLCMCVDKEYWQRGRLFFEKSRVLAIENNSRAIALSDSNKKAIQRAWNEIYQLIVQENVAQENAFSFNDETAYEGQDESMQLAIA